MRWRNLILLLLAIWPRPSHAESARDVDEEPSERYQYFSISKGKGLFPSIFNLATHADIRATSTCGQHSPEEYCKLTEHVYLRRPQCDICDANTALKEHPIDYAIDGTWKWWQSPSLSNGLAYEKVNITLDLRQEFQIAYVIIKAGISPRPGTWVLEKSLDGINFTPWQYYARHDPECMRLFGVPASVGVPRFTSDSEVICTSSYSKLDPMERGEIHTSLVNGRPTAAHPSAELQDFTKARFIRLRLISLRAMNADLMVINRRDEKLDQSVTRRYFYSISDISIGGQCICSGHAETCKPDELYGQSRCECRHNTCGPSCNECCPLFNQLPFRQGTHEHPNVCEACQCFNHADKCVYDEEVEAQKTSVTPEGRYEGGGRCVDCQHNTDGINCEKCKGEYYRPANVSHYLPHACQPCDCDPVGSESNQCIADQTSTIDGLSPGDCICKPGFGGRRCDRCAPGFRNHPTCERCPCNQAGSLNFETCEETDCICKKNVEGEFCDRCKPGTIYLSKDNPEGCQSCFCFGKSEDCTEQRWTTGLIQSVSNWNLSDVHSQLNVPVQSTSTELLIFNSEEYPETQHNLYYFKAPKLFVGDRLKSYGASLHYYVYYVPGERGGHPLSLADVILEGNGRKIEYHTRVNFFPRENISVTIPIKENGWYDSSNLHPVRKSEFMQVLANVEQFKIRAKYHQDQLQSSIYGLTLETAELAGSDGQVHVPQLIQRHRVEQCTCPEHFVGSSCEACDVGYRRVNNQLQDGVCEKCNCQEHSESCDPFTGHCLNCQHNTTSTRCEQCLPGYYGNPLLGGILGACKPCACPLVDNSHSPSCSLAELELESAAAAGHDEFVCTACEHGYEGTKCEACADGYFGNPLEPEGTCQPCECHGNIDPMEIGNCNRLTGKCERCTHHTAGDHCEVCEENHWGSALRHSCHPCNCHPLGSVASQCNNDTGICECVENYTGERCDRCIPGHGDIENYCPECNCSPIGALGENCDEASGQCLCKPGVFGKQCDRCAAGYYGFSEQGCTYCQCNAWGSIENQICNNATGECQCQPNVQGLRCEECVKGFFNITSGKGCEACGCDPLGAEDETCDLVIGQCICKPGVTGLKCDKCAPNHFGLSEEGCKQCRVCPAPGQVCDSETGECVCPPNTVGDVCESCAANAWNYDPLKGCTLCNCNGIGADESECDPRNGQCKCKQGYVGHQCDRCEPGYFNFPTCEPCNCNVAGTEPSECRDESCLCTNEGQCTCKKSVTGLKCDQCEANSFSLDKHNPNGCTDCFCFNRTNFCVQSNLVWSQVYAPERKVTFENPYEIFTRRHNIHILKSSPLNYNSYPTNHTPLYWPLPDQFLGDRTNSYNGFIRFQINNEDNTRTFKQILPEPQYFYNFPQVLLVGNHRLELEHVPVEISLDGKYKVRLHESSWRNRITPQIPVTRKQLMVALQNVQGIYVRGTYNVMYRGDSIALKEVSLDVAVEGSSDNIEATAVGVESCGDCPPGYDGLSCQKPAIGYFRKKIPGYLNDPDDITLVGNVSLCGCNSHSEHCEPETGRCIDCHHNTVGDFCEQCKPGYYGDATEGSPESCRKCACPLLDNSFSDTCRPSADGKDYICDGCRPGYGGQYCQQCLPGYYGTPSVPGGSCQPCGCHAYGSIHNVCHNTTGQCECQNGVEGRDCSVCSPRHAFMQGVCSSCDQGCYKVLMELEDEMENQISSVGDLAGVKPLPRKRLTRIENTATTLNDVLDTIKSNEGNVQDLLIGFGDENRHLKQSDLVVSQFKLLTEKNEDALEKLEELKTSIAQVRKNVDDSTRKAETINQDLEKFTRNFGGNKEDINNQVHYLVTQANAYLDVVRNRSEVINKQYNYAKKNADDAELLLKEILSKKLNESRYEGFKQTADKYYRLLKDYRDTLWDQGRGNITAAKDFTVYAKERLGQLHETVNKISQLQKKSDSSLNAAKENVVQLNDIVQQIQDDYQNITDIQVPALQKNKESLTDSNKDIGDILNDHRSNNVYKVELHANELETQSNRLKNAFSDTKRYSHPALAASTAYSEIVSAIKNASAAVAEASENAAEAKKLVDLNNDKSIVTLAQQVSKQTDELQNRVFESQNNDDYVVKNNQKLKNILDNLGNTNNNIHENITRLKSDQELFYDHHERINTVWNNVETAQNNVKKTETKIGSLVEEVNNINERVNAANNFNQQNIKDNIANVTDVLKNVHSMGEKLAVIRERSAAQEGQINDIKKNLKVLKEKINEAREKASKIRIALKSDEETDCSREYVSPMNPSPTNTISIKFRPALDSPDSLIFFTATKGTRTQNREYLAVELKSKKIHIAWDIGAGRRDASIIKKNIIYIPASDRYSWYHIDITRIGNTIKASVVQKKTASGEAKNVDEPAEIMVGEPDVNGDLYLNTNPGQTKIYVGHPDSKVTEELDLVTNKFRGVIGELVVDGINVPLWVFDSNNGRCDGATGVPAAASSGHMFRNGFAQVRMPMAERANTMVSVIFSAYSKNGLIYFRGSPESKDYLAIQLENGHVVVRAMIAGKAAVNLKSALNTYADGRTHKVRTIRKDQEVHLHVDDGIGQDKMSAKVDGDDVLALNISNNEHYVAGVPPDFKKAPFNDVQFDGFFGCIQSVRPTQVNELDLDHPVRSQRKEPGCVFSEERLTPNDHVIGFTKPGYLLGKGFALGPEGTFSFNFRSKQPDALLLYQSGGIGERLKRGVDESFIAFYLVEGRLTVHLNTENGVKAVLHSVETYGDSLAHSVFLARNGGQVILRIDDREAIDTTLDDDGVIGSESAALHLGGLPSRSVESPTGQGTGEPLVGCLSNFYVNYKKLSIVPEEHQASLGVCEFEPKLEIPIGEQNETTVQGHERRHSKLVLTVEKPRVNSLVKHETCYAPAENEGQFMAEQGYRFGVSPSSNARLNFQQPYPDYENFELKLDIKTSQRHGLLWAWANYKSFTKYFYLYIYRGFIVVEVKGRSEPKKIHYRHVKINDDQWHTVELSKQGRVMSLKVDEHPAEDVQDVPNPKVMKKRMYIGNVISKHRRQFNITIPGYQGCIKNFAVNGVVQDLAVNSRDVIGCVKSNEVDYIHSGGFAMFSPTWKYGEKPEVRLGVTLKNADVKKALILGLVNPDKHDYQSKQVALTVDDGELVFKAHLAEYNIFVDRKLGLIMCPKAWHRIDFLLADHTVTINLDDQQSSFPLKITRQAMNEIKHLNVFLGGSVAPVLSHLNTTTIQGCVKGWEMQDYIVPLDRARKSSKLVANGCPFL